jgi:hypothetical protein
MPESLFDDAREALDWLVARIDFLDPGSKQVVPNDQQLQSARVREALREGVRLQTTDGLPADLARVLRDPTVVVPRDHEVRLADGRTLHEHLEEWRNAPSNTASAE